MPEIKRPNYFTSEFLVEADFNDEQKYHRDMRYRHHQSFHTWGVVDGLNVTKKGNSQVDISAGVAVDNEGREIILVAADPSPQPLTLNGTGDVFYITIEYQEVRDDKDKDTTSGLSDQYRRITERPLIKSTTTLPPSDGKVLLLAKVKLKDGNIDGAPDNTVRTFASAKIAAGAIGLDQLAPSIRPIVSIDGVSNAGGNVDLVATNAITLTSNNTTKQIAIGENHSALTNNPHATTAAQVGALPIGGGTLTGNLTVNGRLNSPTDLTVGSFSLPQVAGRISVAGVNAELSFARRNLTAWPAVPVAGDRFVWYNNDGGNARLYTDVKGDLLTVSKDGNVGIGIAQSSVKLQVAGGETVLEQEPWQTPALQNGWVRYDNTYNPPSYFKDSMGIVHLRGLVRTGTMRTAVFTLPSGYRPEFRELFATSCANVNVTAYGRLDIANDGQVIPWEGTNGFVSLDGITFRASVGRIFSDPRIVDPRIFIDNPIGRNIGLPNP